jgi:hypothetical protein
MICLSGVVVPVFLDTVTDPTHLLRQWTCVYHYGHIYMPALCVATCGLYGYTALSKHLNRKPWLIFIVAGAVTMAMVPFTWVMMAPTNNALFRLEALATASTSAADLSAVQEIVVRWSWLHIVRSLFPLAGVFLGFTGILQELGL